MASEQQRLEAAIAGIESQRTLLGDALADAALAPLHEKLRALAAGQADLAAAQQTLRQVSILFLDVVGSTSLSQKLDPEEILGVVDGALARCTAIVEAHQGKVLQYAGDSLLAVFGAEGAREDDPERAVRAGLALLAEGRLLGDEVRRLHGHAGFDVRVGLHTGGVLLGGGVSAEGTIRGLAVNVAARMEQTAPPGALRISHDTYRHVRGVFDVEAQPPIEVKGIASPMVTYLVLRAKPRAFRVATRGIEGVETRMVGRNAELGLLQDSFERLYDSGGLAAVTVVGDAGVGKSRLLDEFRNWAEARTETFIIFQGRALPQTESQPYGLLRDVLAWRLQIADSDSMELAKRKLEQGIAPLFERDDGPQMAQAHAHLLGHLIGLDFADSTHVRGIRDDARQIRSRGLHAAAQMLRRAAAAAQTPIVLLLEDLHWADEESLDFLAHLGEVNRDVPMLMLGLTRPALFERRPGWAPTGASTIRIELGPLDKALSRELADELLKKLREVPAALRELVTGGAEGNPFYMEELVKMLVDEGAIRTDGEHWAVVPDRLLATRVPQSLVGVLQARLDGLQPARKLALQQASVIGLVFWDQALTAIDTRAAESLPPLQQRELIVPHPDAGLDGVREYGFKHQILHQVTYETLLKRTRRAIHLQVAQWLSGLAGSRANAFLGITAEHFEKGGNDRQACAYHARAAEQAAGVFAHQAAMGHVARALALLDRGAATDGGEQADAQLLRWRLLDLRERTLDLQGKRAEQQADIEALQGLAQALDDDRRRAEVAWRRCDFALRTGDFHAQEAAAREAMALAVRAGDDALRLRAQQRLASALTMLGDLAAGKALAQQGLASARSLGLRLAEGLFLNLLSIIAGMQDDHVENLELSQKRLSIDRELGRRQGEAITLLNLGNAWLGLGQHERARSDLEEGLRLTRAVGDLAGEPVALVCLSDLALRQGEAETARVQAQAALDIAIAVQSPESEASALCTLGDAELALGHHAQARSAYERAQAVALAIDDPMQHDAAAGLARAALAQGDVARALVTVNGLLAYRADGGTLEGTQAPRLIELTCHQVLARAGDPRAEGVLASAHAELQARARAIADPVLRHSYLHGVPEHRDLLLAWAARKAPG